MRILELHFPRPSGEPVMPGAYGELPLPVAQGCYHVVDLQAEFWAQPLSTAIWSQINREHVRRLTRAGRMKPPGQRQVDAARADGRWKAAYAPIRAATEDTIPDDLRHAIDADPRARETFQTLGRQNLFALAFRTNNMKTPAGRARKVAALVAMLARGETIIPESGRRRTVP